MLLESRVDDTTILVFDVETVGGIDKGSMTTVSHPDQVVPTTMKAIRNVASVMGAAMEAAGGRPPVSMRVEFAVRVDSNSVVQIARGIDQGQFKVTLQWDA